jgi:hypothetical protein
MSRLEDVHGEDRVHVMVPVQLPGSHQVLITLVASAVDARVMVSEWTEDLVREHLGSLGMLYQDALRIESRRPRG